MVDEDVLWDTTRNLILERKLFNTGVKTTRWHYQKEMSNTFKSVAESTQITTVVHANMIIMSGLECIDVWKFVSVQHNYHLLLVLSGQRCVTHQVSLRWHKYRDTRFHRSDTSIDGQRCVTHQVSQRWHKYRVVRDLWHTWYRWRNTRTKRLKFQKAEDSFSWSGLQWKCGLTKTIYFSPSTNGRQSYLD